MDAHTFEVRADGRPGEFFSWAELETTSTGLPNRAPLSAQYRLQILAQRVLDPLRRHIKRPIRVTSGYRSHAVNLRVRGARNSRHKTGEAADLKVEGMSAAELVAAILEAGLSFDQVIAYAPSRGGHVHLQICAGAPGRHRMQLLWAPASGGYEPFTLPAAP